MLIVDGANVVGSRPDGWWRDRPGAARRLYEQLVAAPLDDVVLVLEGAARSGVEERAGRVAVVHAAGSGDDAIASLAASGCTVVTADRGLAERVQAAGATVVGPRWLLGRLP